MNQIPRKIQFKLFQVRNYFFSIIHYHLKRYQVEDAVLVHGTGRSGTTWLAELIARSLNYHVMDEPLKLSNSYKAQKLQLTGWSQPVYEGSEWPELERFLFDILTGRELNPNYFLGYRQPFFPKGWVIKFIRLHFMLPWFVEKFKTRPVIHIVRNPYDVIRSQMNHPGFNSPFVKQNRIPDIPVNRDFFLPYEHIFVDLRNTVERNTFMWCMHNSFLLRHPENNVGWKTVNYDSLKNNDQNLQTLFELLGYSKDEYNLVESSKRSKSSLSTKPKELSVEDQNSIDRIIRKFDFEIFDLDRTVLKPEYFAIP